ncbi:hypothetical protein ACQ4WP_28325 [Janthinobacterium sp. GB4P2]|uniref:hypothetical protein n=1 Tax=Janthinobacterium sp. GB4P2 TaxID=3424189 RepID=UPI003F1F50B5
MKITKLQPGFTVIDDFLASDEFSELWGGIEKIKYDFPTSEWMRLWPLTDPQPVMSGPFLWSRRPCGYGVDDYIDQFRSCIANTENWFADVPAWCDIAFRVFLHGRGSRMVAHSDAPKYTGAGVFYAHQKWDANWGGELCFPEVDLDTNFCVREAGGESISNTRLNEMLEKMGTGIYVSPKPNRLVLIRGGTLHYTNRVDADAGSNLRCTLTSFLIGANQNDFHNDGIKSFSLE